MQNNSNSMPLVSVVVPVYNVEKYLRECLDSIFTQTFSNWEVICVNDGSPDGSRDILQEYSDRITIIDKENGGLSSARNAAYPYIKGKYTLFVDSDDTIDSTLLEKTVAKAETTGADMTLFFCKEGNRRGQWSNRVMTAITPDDKTTVAEKKTVLPWMTAWSKLWRSDFLLNNNLRCPEGLIFEDNALHWQAVVLARKISVVYERLYTARDNADSITGKKWDKRVFDLIEIFKRIESFLTESGHYEDYRDEFHRTRLTALGMSYNNRCSRALQPLFKQHIFDSITERDKAYIDGLKGSTRAFYRNSLSYQCRIWLRNFERHVIRMPLKAFTQRFRKKQ